MVDLPLSSLSSSENDTVALLSDQLEKVQTENRLKAAYYDAKAATKDLGIAIPPELAGIETVVGWPGTVVDVLEERLDFLGWSDPAFEDVYLLNELDAESSGGHTDALVHGVAFVTSGAGGEGEPDVVVTVEGPSTMTARWDRRSRKVMAAYGVDAVDDATGQTTAATLYLPNERVSMERRSGRWVVADRDRHNLGRTCVRRLVNRWRTSKPNGRSEITPAIRTLTDSCVRTLLGVEVAREFFAAPQRWIMGADPSSFQDADGNPITAWQSYLGRFLALNRDENGDLPQVGQFAASSPDAFWSTIRGYAQLLSAEAAIPVSYLGLSTDQPPSADSVRALEARLIKRAERRHSTFGRTWAGVGSDVALIRDPQSATVANEPPPTPLWRDAATPTRAAAADATSKLVQAGVLPADSSVTWDLLGLSPDQQRRLATDLARRNATAFAAAVDDEAATQ